MLYFFDSVSIGVDHTILYICSRVIVSIMQFLGAKDNSQRNQRSLWERNQSSQLTDGYPHLAQWDLFCAGDGGKGGVGGVFVKQ